MGILRSGMFVGLLVVGVAWSWGGREGSPNSDPQTTPAILNASPQADPLKQARWQGDKEADNQSNQGILIKSKT